MIINRQFGSYFVLKRIGVGGMAEIFLAMRRGPDAFEKLYALKAIMGGREDNATFAHMFQTEAEVAARFNHPHVVQLYDVVTIDGTDIMVMEFIPGHTLEEVVQISRSRGRELPPDLAVFLLMEVCEGLDYIHSLTDWDGTPLGIVHRDMSPQNIMVTYDGVAKVFDFGIAQLTTRPDNHAVLGSMIGKLGYMPPEQVRGEAAVDARADVFAMGCILWEMTVGRPLFTQKNDLALINALMEEALPRPSDVIDRYPRLLERIVMRALEKDPLERFASCGELREELLKYLKISALKPDRRQAAAFMSELFAQEIRDFCAEMEMARSMAQEKDPTLNIDVRQLMAAVHTEMAAQGMESATIPPSSMMAATAARVEESKPAARMAAQVPGPAAPPPAAPAGRSAALKESGSPDMATRDTELPPMVPPTASGSKRGAVIALAVVAVVLLVGAAALAGYYAAVGGIGAPKEAPAPRAGSLTLETTPPGAVVSLNGRRLSVQTPVTLPELPFGEPQAVRLELDGYKPAERTLTLSAAQPAETVRVEFEPEAARKAVGSGTVRLTLSPESAAVYLDGAKVEADSTGTLVLSDVGAGIEHSLRVTAEGYEDALLAFTLKDREARDFEVELVESSAEAMASLSIKSEPAGRRVLIDDEFVGLTPLVGLRLPSGTPLRLTVEDARLGAWTQSVVLEPGEAREVTAQLGQKVEESAPTGLLSINSTPPTEVFIGGRSCGQTPLTGIAAPLGEVVVELRDSKLRIRHAERVKVEAGGTAELNVTIPEGTLNVRSDPAGVVLLDGVEIGDTPVEGHSLYAGNHVVIVRVPSLGRQKEIRVKIRGGEVRDINARFAAAEVARVDEGTKGESGEGKGEGEGEGEGKGGEVKQAPPREEPRPPASAPNKPPEKKTPPPKDDEPYPLLK